MKNIKPYVANKYDTCGYEKQGNNIYKYKDVYVTSMKFVQEPDLGEGENAGLISQYPLEDILDEYNVNISDFYEELNSADSETCYIEFASADIENVKALQKIVGKHVYNKSVKQGNEIFVELIIE